MKHLILALLLIPCPHVTVLSVAPPNVVLTDLGEKDDRAAAKPGLVERLQNRMMELDAAIEAAARPVWKKPGA
jgi:hypothetical protein